jgi:3-oxoacyl-[acyl-carrier protein] reductase
VKAAVSAFSKSLAKSVGPRVRVNCVAPGWIQTEWGSGVSQDWDRRATGESILQRWGQPEDIARVIVALCSPDFEFVNGQTIAVNGGWQSMLLSVRSNCTWN